MLGSQVSTTTRGQLLKEHQVEPDCPEVGVQPLVAVGSAGMCRYTWLKKHYLIKTLFTLGYTVSDFTALVLC